MSMYIDGKNAMVKAYSPDGVRWTSDGKPWFGHNHNSNLLGWDPRIQRYVLFSRMAGAPVSVGCSISSYFSTWSDLEKVLGPEPFKDSRAFKGMPHSFIEVTKKIAHGDIVRIARGPLHGLIGTLEQEVSGSERVAAC